MSAFLMSQQPSLERDDPTWFHNPTKRIIPNHLVPKRKLGFALTTPKKNDLAASKTLAKGFGTTDFNLISFGNLTHRPSASLDTLLLQVGEDTTILENADDLPLYNDGEDLPPARSVYDLDNETAFRKPTEHAESFINKDPRGFPNAFSSNKATPSVAKEHAGSDNTERHNEAAILVFGYPEHMANQVISYFAEFGKILEDFEVTRSSKKQGFALSSLTSSVLFPHTEKPARAPIFSGKSWVKITYENLALVSDALQESGSVFNGALIGVVPYTKDAVGKLQNRRLSPLEDIGGGYEVPSALKVDDVVGEAADSGYLKKIELKDGAKMFLKANAPGSEDAKKETRKLGIMDTVTNFLFGFHDL